MRVIDLFAGCGGLSLGFQQAGYTIVAAYDHWLPAVQVYQQNFAHPVYQHDVRLFVQHPDELRRQQPDLLIGGPPCQDFSSAGKRDEGLGRSDLTVTFADVVRAIQPAVFVMENVARARTSRAFALAKALLSPLYGLTEMVLDASRCGVPQYRKRLFLIGIRDGVANALNPYLTAGLAPRPLTVRDYMGHSLDIEYYYRHPRSYARRAIYSIDEPSPTVRGVNRPIPATYQAHPGDAIRLDAGIPVRPLTTEERSRLQTFPADFIWMGTKSAREQMIGNAVPVAQAAYVAQCLASFLQGTPSISHAVQPVLL